MVSLNPFFPDEKDYRVTNSQRAFIKNEDTGDEFTVMFNPEDYSYKLSAEDGENEKDQDVLTVSNGTVSSKNESVELPFHSTGIGDLDVSLQYHAFDSSVDIRSEIKDLQELTLPSVSSGSVRRRPECSFNWEDFYYFGYITEADAKYTMFDSDGKPLRAELSLTFKAIIPEKDKKTYSGFEGCRKTWIVKSNDRLDLIANAIYQDAKQWLFIAKENDIDNPIKFPTPNDIGRVLILPDLPTQDNDMGKPIAKILIDNAEATECSMEELIEVVVEEELNLPTMFYFLLSIIDEESGPWKNVDLSKFAPGKAVAISMGLETEKELFKGEITAVDISFSSVPYIEVRGFDRLHRLQFGRKNRSFAEQKDSQIVSTIASEEGLSASADATTTVYPCLFQLNQTNYHFLLERARKIGYELMADDKKLIFRKSQEDKSATISLYFGKDIFDFNVSLRTIHQGDVVEARGWDVTKKEEILGSGKAGSEVSKMGGSQTGHAMATSAFKSAENTIINENFIDKSDADTRAAAFYNETQHDFITGEGTYSGTEQIRVGTTIEITNLGEKFSGSYYVTATTHALNKKQYTTKFKVRKIGI